MDILTGMSMQNRLQVLLLYRAQGGGLCPFAVQSYNENSVNVQMTCLDREAFFSKDNMVRGNSSLSKANCI